MKRRAASEGLQLFRGAALDSVLAFKGHIRIIGTLSLDDLLERAPQDLRVNDFDSSATGAVTMRHVLGELKASRFPTTPIHLPQREPHI